MASSLLDRMRANPRADWTIGGVERLCRQSGLTCVPPRGGGSHFKVQRPGRLPILTIPARRPIKSVHIRALLNLVAEGEGSA